MGAVHAALRRGTFGIAQLVAVKTMTSGVADDPAAREAFLREARILARLAHPNVVRWLDAGEVGADVYIAMELLHGVSLAALLAASPEPVPLPVAIAILLDLSRGLHAAHELGDEAGRALGLVHQDVSPQNAVVGYDGRTRLVDFGVARLASVDASRTDTVRGKPSYLAPEQLEGRRLDRRTDVFALGVIAFELLTGRRLFARSSIAETHTAVLFDPIPDVHAMRADVPGGVAAAVRRALARSRDDRWPTADAFRRALAIARDEASIPDAEDPEIGAFARRCVPPPWTPEQLFAEIQGSRPPAEAAAYGEISQAVTVAPRRESPPGEGIQTATVAPRRESPPADDSQTATVAPRPAPPANDLSQPVSAGPPAERSGVSPTAAPGPISPPPPEPSPRGKAPVWWWGVSLALLAAVTVIGLRTPWRPRGAAPGSGPTTAVQLAASAAVGDVPTSGVAPPPGANALPPADPTVAPSAAPETPIQRSASANVGAQALTVSESAGAAPPSAAAPATSAASRATATASAAPSLTPTVGAVPPVTPTESAAPSAPAVAAAPVTGWISVWSTPWGRVRIDGRAVGDSPAVRIVVPPGPHMVTVKSDTGEQSKSVSVKVGEESKVRFVF